MNNLPDYIQNRQSRGLAARVSQNLGTSSPPYLSIMGNRFTLVDAAGNEQAIPTYEADPNKCMRGQNPGPYADVVIVDVNDHVSRIYYDVAFDPNAQSYQPPACFSHNGQAPSKLASQPQSPTCAGCPHSVWGSATSNVSGKAIPACAQYQFIAVLVAGHETPFLLRIPPNSLKNYRAYAEQFRGQKFDMEMVWTRLSFVSQGTLSFMPARFAQQETLDLSDRLFTAKAMDSMVGRLDQPIQGMLPAPGGQGQQSPLPAQSAGFQSMPAAQPQTQTALPATAASPSSPAQPAGRGRPRRNTAQPAPQPAQQPAQTQAPFMDPAGQPGQVGQGQPVPQGHAAAGPMPANGGFGMQPGVPPNPEMSTMLDNLFGPAGGNR